MLDPNFFLIGFPEAGSGRQQRQQEHREATLAGDVVLDPTQDKSRTTRAMARAAGGL